MPNSLKQPSRVILLSPGRTGTVSLAYILSRCAPSPESVVLHEHPLARCILPLTHVQPVISAKLAVWLAFPLQGVQLVRIDPLLSYCGVEALASRADKLIFLSRSPVDWVESLARKIRHQRLFPLIRSLPILRPPAPSGLLRQLRADLPGEDPYLLSLLAAYVNLHRRVNALPALALSSALKLSYEQLYGSPYCSSWLEAWRSLFDALGWPQLPAHQIAVLLQRRLNMAPVRSHGFIRDSQRVTSIVQSLINHTSPKTIDF